ncbi:hypothetical protein [Streptomyces sp. NPDC050164]|uniref:hypothetical protein n=1 Tax=Streptomyces sp. NPDC050164 TaxID=3365605 RepID=UPI0037B34E3D
MADECALPGDYRKFLAIVRGGYAFMGAAHSQGWRTAGRADGPEQVRVVGERLGLDTSVRGKLEPLHAKMTKLPDRGWLHVRNCACGAVTGGPQRELSCVKKNNDTVEGPDSLV